MTLRAFIFNYWQEIEASCRGKCCGNLSYNNKRVDNVSVMTTIVTFCCQFDVCVLITYISVSFDMCRASK
jgi:hypothetical protein